MIHRRPGASFSDSRIAIILAVSLLSAAYPSFAQSQYDFERISSKLHHGLYAYIDARGMEQKVFVPDPSGWEDDPSSLPVKPMPEDVAQELRDAEIREWSLMTPLPAASGGSNAAAFSTNGSTSEPVSQSGRGCAGCGPAGKAINAVANVSSSAKKSLKKVGSTIVPAAHSISQIAVPLLLGGTAYLASRSGGFGTAGGGNGYSSYPKSFLVQFNCQSRIYHHPLCPHAARCTVHCIQISLPEAHSIGGQACRNCNGGNGA